MRRAAFLDRDGTIMVDTGYCHEPEKVRLIENAAEGLRLLSEGGFFLAIVTNQSGIARGYFTERELTAVNSRLREELQAKGVDFNALVYCPHSPLDQCDCRKPRPGLILRAASDHGLDLNSSFTIGDQESDIAAGRSAGTKTVLVSDEGRSSGFADFYARNLAEAARLILGGSVASDAQSRTPLATSNRKN